MSSPGLGPRIASGRQQAFETNDRSGKVHGREFSPCGGSFARAFRTGVDGRFPLQDSCPMGPPVRSACSTYPSERRAQRDGRRRLPGCSHFPDTQGEGCQRRSLKIVRDNATMLCYIETETRRRSAPRVVGDVVERSIGWEGERVSDDAGVLKGWLLPQGHEAARLVGRAQAEDDRGARADEISKKELLAVTGLSYGQLYRWKRMGLIPEHWFVHRATFTGQETFFPRRQIMERIATIQRLKERYSLEEIAELLSPASSGRRYPLDEIQRLDLCPPEGLAVLATIQQSAGRPKRGLSPEQQALLAPVDRNRAAVASSGPRASQGWSRSTNRGPDQSREPASYTFVDLVAGAMAAELIRRGLAPSAVRAGAETLLAGAWQYSTLDDVHLVCAHVGEPPAEFCALYSGLEPVVFGPGVTVMADVAVGPFAESLRQSLQSRHG